MRVLVTLACLATFATANAATPTLWLIGDSTVHNGRGDGSNGQWGWGEPLAGRIDPAKWKVVNRARGGRSSRTYLAEGLWDDVLNQLQPGDWVLIQFGHNDSSPINDDSRARGVIHGTGDETQEIDNLLTHKHETIHTYGWYLRQFVKQAKAKGAHPVICTLIPRNNFKDGRVQRSDSTWAGWARKVAADEKIPLLDLNRLIADRYDEMGESSVAALFHGDHTHTSRAGAELNAQIVAEALAALPDSPFQGALVAGPGSR